MAAAIKKLNYYHRLLVTGLSFLLFGIGGVLIGLLAYPILLCFDKQNRHLKGQKLIHLCFKLFAGFMRMVGIFSIEIRHLERLQRSDGLFVIANHPTLIDVVLLLSLLERSDCVVKSALASSPFTRGPLLVAGYIVNREPEQLIAGCVKSLQAGRNLLIFPEGTRTKDLNGLDFQRGAAIIALEAAHNLTPIYIKCSPRMLAKGEKWYKIPDSKPHFVITVGEDIAVKPLLETATEESHRSALSRQLTRKMLAHYNKELELGNNHTRIETVNH